MQAERGGSVPVSAPGAAEGLPRPRRYAAIAAIWLGTVLTTVDGTIVNVALPTLARDLHVQPSEAVLVVTVYQLMLMATLLPFSALGQRFGYRTTYQCGQMVFVVATILCFFAKNLPFLVLIRGCQALGAAAAMSVGPALIRSIYPASQLGRGLSLNTVIAATSASIAPTVGGAVLAIASWPWLFGLVVPFGLLSVLIGRKTLPEGISRNSPYDVLGAVMCAATVGLVISGLESGIHGSSPVISLAIVILGVVLGFFFVRRELGQAQPVFPVDLLRLKAIALPCLGSLAAYLATMILMVTLPFQLQQRFHFTPAAAGAALAPMAMMSMVVAPVSGLLSDRYPAGALGAMGMAIAFVGLSSFAFLPAAPGQLDIVWRIAICGFGFGMFFSPNARQVVGAAPASRIAAAGALFSTTRGAGQTLGSTAVAALLAIGVGASPVPALIAAALALIAGLCSLEAVRPARQGPSLGDFPAV